MSLLMDALKRAEETKRHAPGEAGAARELALEKTEPAPAREAARSPLPDLDSHLDAVDQELKAAASAAPPPRDGVPRHLARNVLAAGPGAPSPTARRIAAPAQKRLAVIIGLGAGAALMLGAYFYWRLSTLTPNSDLLARAPTPATTIAATRVTPATPAAAETPAANAAPAAGEKTPLSGPDRPRPSAADRRATAATTSTSATPGASGATGTAGPAGVGAATASLRARAARRTPPATAPLRATATGAETRPPAGGGDDSPVATDPTGGQPSGRRHGESPTQRGYQAWSAGRLDEARAAYAEALRADRRDLDALLGLAAIARRQGHAAEARGHLERVLRLDPRNAHAAAALAGLESAGDPLIAESRLKSLIALQVSDGNATSALYFALGNLYAARGRWPEAQQAFFRAHTADEGNPDTLYNLAVALEHLNQPPLARRHYQQALEAARGRAAAFDPAEAERRIAALAR